MQAYIDELTKQVAVKARQVEKKASKQVMSSAAKRLGEIFYDTIDAFYGDYDPKYYNRTSSLYNLLQIETVRDGEALKIWFEPSFMSEYERPFGGISAEDGLYTDVFRQGWHGGARFGPAHPKSGIPFWRVPENIYSAWGSRAARSDSPLEEYRKAVKEYEARELEPEFIRRFYEEWAKVKW